MATVKAGGTSKNIHNNAGQRLGVKRFGGQKVKEGEVIVRQTGSTKLAGKALIYRAITPFMRRKTAWLILRALKRLLLRGVSRLALLSM
jgi:large subunit ribosomal protein L27